MKIKVFYRNYRKLHPLYKSLETDPTNGIEYLFPNVQKGYITKLGFKIYRMTGSYKFVTKPINFAQDKIFMKSNNKDPVDLLEYIQIVPLELPNKPYVVDVEHCGGLFNFRIPDKSQKGLVFNFLSDPKCKKIICTSKAAKRSFKQYFTKDELQRFTDKIVVIYPALSIENSMKSKPVKEPLNILFVGAKNYRKGLHEVLEAFKKLDPERFTLKAIVKDSDQLVKGNKLPNVQFFGWDYTHSEVLEKFFKPADLFIMPTHTDTFGMVLLDALSSGTPVITTRQFASPEIIKDCVNGRFVRSERLYLDKEYVKVNPHNYSSNFPKDPEKILVDSIVKVLNELADDYEKIVQMQNNALKDFKPGGKFSVERRNNDLLNVYNDLGI